MSASQYVHFTADAFAVDPRFRKWCTEGNEGNDAFWDVFLLKHPEKAEEIEQARQIVLGVDQHFARQPVSPDEIEHRYHQTLQAAQQRSRTIKMQQHNRPLRVAAALALLIAAAATLSYRTFILSDEPVLVEYRTEYGQQQTVQLPDGSTVRLNADSKLMLSQAWDDEAQREVWLEGEAYFSVEKKPATQAKFVVHAQGLNVEVLGTQFNVSTEVEATQVVLDEGKIKLSVTNATGAETDTMTMVPGEMARLSQATQEITKQLVSAPLHSTWKDGYLTYQEATLAEVLDDVHRTFGYTILVKDSLLLNETLTGALSSHDLDELLTVLKDIMPTISFTKEQQRLIVDTKQ